MRPAGYLTSHHVAHRAIWVWDPWFKASTLIFTMRRWRKFQIWRFSWMFLQATENAVACKIQPACRYLPTPAIGASFWVIPLFWSLQLWQHQFNLLSWNGLRNACYIDPAAFWCSGTISCILHRTLRPVPWKLFNILNPKNGDS